MSLSGKIAIVTGGTAGIGLAVARQLVAGGAKVALVARRKTLLDEVVASLGADRAVGFALDVADLKALAKLPGRVVEHFGALDIVVNNAGLNHRGAIKRHTAEELAQVITVNLNAPIVLCRAAVDVLQPGGAIVNVASLAGMIPVPEEATYSASKAGLRAFTRAIREEFPLLNISSVCPGPVDTEFFGGDLKQVPDLVFSQPMSSAEAVADAILHCIEHGEAEVSLPRLSGALATAGYLFPALTRLIRPALERRGAEAKKDYMRRKGVTD